MSNMFQNLNPKHLANLSPKSHSTESQTPKKAVNLSADSFSIFWSEESKALFSNPNKSQRNNEYEEDKQIDGKVKNENSLAILNEQIGHPRVIARIVPCVPVELGATLFDLGQESVGYPLEKPFEVACFNRAVDT